MRTRFRFKSMLIVSSGISEAKKNFIAKQFKLTPEEVVSISEADPTPKKSYTAWLAKVLSQSSGTPEQQMAQIRSLTEPLTRFIRLLNSPGFPADKRDIGQYTAKDLLDLVGDERKYRRNLSDTEIQRLIMKDGLPGAKVVWDSGGFKMWEVTNSKYARFLSSNTSWCTAQPGHSKSYCTSGALYPIYYLGKPFAQGHMNNETSNMEFLDKDDDQIDVLDDLTVQMIETIQNPIMDNFKRKVYSVTSVRSRLQEDYSQTGKVDPKFRSMALASGNLGVIAEVCRYEWWDEGWDILLDHPELFALTIDHVKPGVLADHPEISDEMLSQYTPDNLSGHNISVFLRFGRVDLLLDLLLKGGMSEASNILSNYIPYEFVDMFKSEVTKKVEALEEPSREYRNTITRIGNSDIMYAYWKKFIQKPVPDWRQLRVFPDYAKITREFSAFPHLLKEGDAVKSGPDNKNKESKTGEVISVETRHFLDRSTETDYTVKWEDGSEETLVYAPGEDTYEIVPMTAKPQPYVKVKVDENGRLPEGTRVMAIHDSGWRWGGQDELDGEPGPGTIVKVHDAGATGYDYEIKWDNGDRFLYPMHNVGPVPVPVELPSLNAGDRVKKGPTFRWETDGEHSDSGVVVEVGRNPDGVLDGYWVTVNWDEEDPDEYDITLDDADEARETGDGTEDGPIPGFVYRFGLAEESGSDFIENGFFYADVIPESADPDEIKELLQSKGLLDARWQTRGVV